MKSTEAISGVHFGLKVLQSVLVATVLYVGILFHVRMLNLSNENKNKKQQLHSSNSKSGGKRKKLLLLGVLFGLSASVWIFFCMNEEIIMRRIDTLENMCDERARMLQDQFNVSMNHVQALAILVSTFHHGKNPSAIDQVALIHVFTFSWILSLLEEKNITGRVRLWYGNMHITD